MNKIIKIFLICIGFLCVGLGTIGIVTPLLPTTPFYLLATMCFAKSSERFYRWLISKNLYKNHIANFANSRSMTFKAKLAILVPVTVMMLLTCLIVDVLAVRIIIVVLLLTKHVYFIFIIRTIKVCSKNQSDVR